MTLRIGVLGAHGGVDAWCDVELGFPGGATGLSANSMVAEDYSFTIRIVGTKGDVLVAATSSGRMRTTG